MTAVTIIVDIILIIVAIVLILAVLMQQGQRQGLGAIGGGAETFFGKNKAKSYEGKLEMLTKICAVVFIVLALVATILTGTDKKVDFDEDIEEAETEAVDMIEEEAEDSGLSLDVDTKAVEETAEEVEEAVEETKEVVEEALEETEEAVEEAVEEVTED